MAQDVVYPGECSMCTWEGGVFFCIWMECPEDINEIISSNVSFKTCVSSLIFCFDDLSIGVSGVLKSPTIIVLLSISPLMSFVVDFVDLCSSLVFLDYKIPFNICYKAGLVILNSLMLIWKAFYFSINSEWDPCQV